MEPAPFLEDIADGPEGAKAYWLRAKDSTRVRVGVWPAGPKGTILMFPGRTEYIEKYGRLARDLAIRDPETNDALIDTAIAEERRDAVRAILSGE